MVSRKESKKKKKGKLMATNHLGRLHHDLLAQVMARVDGSTLAAAACTCTDIRSVAHEEQLWEDLCHSTWPSTQGKKAQSLISSCVGGFSKFYADSYPLIVYKKGPQVLRGPIQETHVAPSHLVSLVDFYYKKKCIFSKVLYGVDGHDDDGDGGHHHHHDGWFMDCPFRLDVLNYENVRRTHDDDDDDDDEDDGDDGHDDGDMMGGLPPIPFVEKKERGSSKLCRKLEENVRLSWVILDTKSGKSVNLSSWKPVLVQRYWPSEGDFLMRFGCVVPMEERVVASGAAECVITVRCQLMETEGWLRWTEISMQVEDKEGAHVSGGRSMKVLEEALGCERSKERGLVERGYGEYVREKRELREKKMKSEGLLDRLCVLSGIGVFAALCFFAF
ncbi:probable F-box protein At2g36090 [Magnolia sinica]|uniref:probable F-box protein At2g36090 n=1 Tax=Magnolia sinica TaxID=86752 RepID=UPI002658DF0C|nr:probable F-box protein At2g36090 [Magnolia sinica]